MRILSWNINGIRTLPKYHPWNTLKTCEGILDELKADIICFQEMKSSRALLPRDVALPGHFDGFFSFPVVKGGYSGVAVFTDARTAVPLKAEEGLSGRLQPQPPLSLEERISSSYPLPEDIIAYPDEQGEVPATFDDLDSEGRGLVLDFGLFVLINVYCPNETSDARLSFKMNYHLLLQERVRKLIEEHREVIVVGDINVCATPLDHCDGHLPSNQETFYDHPARAWFDKWLSPRGPMVDIVRTFWPERKGLYTCWNMRIQARETNYGTRVDYILVTKGLLPWIQHGDILPSLKGSDHCPIYIDLRDELTLDTGETIKLRDAMKQSDTAREPPRLAAKFWDEYSGKQTTLASFFSKGAAPKANANNGVPTSQQTSSPEKSSTPTSSSQTQAARPTPTPNSVPETSSPTPSAATKRAKSSQPSRPPPSTANKRKASEAPATSSKKRKQVKGQASIATFFSKPAASTSSIASSETEVIEIEDNPPQVSTSVTGSIGDAPSSSQADEDQLDADYRLACELARADADDEPIPSSSQNQAQKKAAWSELFAPVQPPKCYVHGEPTRMYTVHKQGPNKGKTFFLCSRPVGPGYDKGKGERLREEVDHQYRCNFFKWTSEVRKEALRERERERTRTKSGGR
ncbi:DNase I-like protein [Trametes coccinea BRFM310]|uniref:DNA-(apurinic or apyrimidinic site) endonuclease n=1 Tax=Trametes coccinea (strain BRFM310) TaxID=1353009 RepID=A0A1Y2IVV2_TRAC3|nr:DNase I-like protein [Trametes coccinea BRFM310]